MHSLSSSSSRCRRFIFSDHINWHWYILTFSFQVNLIPIFILFFPRRTYSLIKFRTRCEGVWRKSRNECLKPIINERGIIFSADKKRLPTAILAAEDRKLIFCLEERKIHFFFRSKFNFSLFFTRLIWSVYLYELQVKVYRL